ncbi:unnamed protein product [Paramecium sonneborni]|uniref:Uncharacterized protein n=1 Tax=Paramecium sonneborni TaxID=65129 RepID=A0A8S1RV35_9CILI|nr:unnamed protein product [Paramecium sonneborni]
MRIKTTLDNTFLKQANNHKNIQNRDSKNIRNNIKIISNIMIKIKDDDFNKNNYSSEKYQKIKKEIIQNIGRNQKIILTSLDEQFILFNVGLMDQIYWQI